MNISSSNKTIVVSVIQGIEQSLKKDPQFSKAMLERHSNQIKSFSGSFDFQNINYEGHHIVCLFNDPKEAVDFAKQLQNEFREYPKLPVKIAIDQGEVRLDQGKLSGNGFETALKMTDSSKAGSVVLSSRVQKNLGNTDDFSAEFIDVFEWDDARDVKLFALEGDNLIIPEADDINAEVKPLDKIGKKGKSSFNHILFTIGILFVATAIFAYLDVLSTDPIIDNYSIAVLPFKNLAEDEEAQILSQGFSNTLLSKLGKLEDLYVIAEHSSLHFKDSDLSNDAIAQDLGVAFLIKGTFHKFGESLRVTTKLIEIKTQDTIWDKTYSREFNEIMNIEAEVAKDVVDALRIKLDFDDMQDIVGIPTGNIEAYKLYEEGNYEALKQSKLGNRKSINFYSEAIRKDTTFALAYTALAEAQLKKIKYGDAKINEVSKLTELYLERAENINENIGQIYTLRGWMNNLKGDSEKAKLALNKAVGLSPNDVLTRLQLADYYLRNEQPRKQLQENKKAYQLDPYNFEVANAYVSALIINKKFDEADALLTKIGSNLDGVDPIEMDRQHAKMYLVKGDYGKSILPLIRLSAIDSVNYGSLGFAYAKIGDTARAYDAIDSIRSKPHFKLKSYNLAKVFAGLGKRDSLDRYLDSIGVSRIKNEDSIYNFFKPYKIK